MRRTKHAMGVALAAALTCTALSGHAWAARSQDALWAALQEESGGVSAVIQASTVVADGTIQVTFDAHKLTYVGCDFVGDREQYAPMVALHAVNESKADQGTVTIAWVAPAEYRLEGEAQGLFQVNFQAKGEVSPEDVTLAGSASDPQGHGVALGSTTTAPAPQPTPTLAPVPTQAPAPSQAPVPSQEPTAAPTGQPATDSTTQPTAAPSGQPGASAAPGSSAQPVEPPDTGDHTSLGLYAALAGTCAAALGVAVAARTHRRDEA